MHASKKVSFSNIGKTKGNSWQTTGCFTWDRAAKGMNIAQTSNKKNKQYERNREIGERKKKKRKELNEME